MSPRRVSLSPFLEKIVGTALTSFTTVACLAVMTRFLAQGLGPEEFGAFSLVRRCISTLEPLVTLGASISITRYIALSQSTSELVNYARSGSALVAVATTLTVLIGLLLSQVLTPLVFGPGDFHALYLSMLAWVWGYSIYITLYSIYRGGGNMLAANLWQLLTIAVGPTVIAVGLSREGNAVRISYSIAALLGLAIFPLIPRLRLFHISKADIAMIRVQAKQMFRYGWPRIPGGVLYGGMLTIGPILAPHLTTLRDAGYLVVGQSMLRIVESGFDAFGRVALPAIAAIFGTQGKAALRERMTDLLGLIFDLGVFSTIQGLLWIHLVVTLWLGPEYTDATLVVQIMALSLTPYLAFVTLRSVLDAIEEKAVTTIYLVVSFALTIATSLVLVGVGLGAVGLAAGFTVGFTLLGFLVVNRISKDLEIAVRDWLKPSCFLYMLALGLVGGAIRYWVREESILDQAMVALAVEIVLLPIFFLGLYRLKAGWLIAVRKRIHLSG